MTTLTLAPTTHAVFAGDDPTAALTALRVSLAKPDRWLALDIETNALDLEDPRFQVRTIQLGTVDTAVVLDASDPALRAAAAAMLSDPAYRLTAHNAQFDLSALAHIGVIADLREVWSRTTDTYILITLVEPPDDDRGYRDLKSLTSAWCGDHAVSKDAKEALHARWKEIGCGDTCKTSWDAYQQGDQLDGNGWANIDLRDPAYIAYAAADVYDSAHLVAELAPVAYSLFPAVVDRENRLAWLACAMRVRGVALDAEHTRAGFDRTNNIRDDALSELRDAGFTGEPAKDVDVIAAFDAEKMPARRTAKGGRSTARVVLHEYIELGSKIAAALDTWRHAAKFSKTYYGRYLRAGGDRIHCTIDTVKAATGRMASSSPNLQNVPGDVRACFVADPGHVFISADFSSVEMRVAAALTGDPELRRMYTEPLQPGEDARARDPYWVMAWRLHGPDATKAHRKAVKAVVLGSMYGGGADTLAENAGLPLEAVHAALGVYKKTFPGLGQWAKATLLPRIEAGMPFWTLPSGRWQSIDPSGHWRSLNKVIQGLSRDILVEAMFRVEDAGLGGYMVMPIHDELLLQVPEDRAEEMLATLVEAMRSELYGVPIPAEGAILGARWEDKDTAPKSAKAESQSNTATTEAPPLEPVDPAQPANPFLVIGGGAYWGAHTEAPFA